MKRRRIVGTEFASSAEALVPETRKGLSEGLIGAALCHQIHWTSDELIETMTTALAELGDWAILQRVVPSEITTPENV